MIVAPRIVQVWTVEGASTAGSRACTDTQLRKQRINGGAACSDSRRQQLSAAIRPVTAYGLLRVHKYNIV